jgi:hypothetical protein
MASLSREPPIYRSLWPPLAKYPAPRNTPRSKRAAIGMVGLVTHPYSPKCVEKLSGKYLTEVMVTYSPRHGEQKVPHGFIRRRMGFKPALLVSSPSVTFVNLSLPFWGLRCTLSIWASSFQAVARFAPRGESRPREEVARLDHSTVPGYLQHQPYIFLHRFYRLRRTEGGPR